MSRIRTPAQLAPSRAGSQMRARPSMLIMMRRVCRPWTSDSVPQRAARLLVSEQLRPILL